MTKRIFLAAAILIALLQSAVIAGMLFKRAAQIESGQEVTLESGFVDPRALFRGHYTRLRLSVGLLNKGTTEIDFAFKRNNDVFVELEKGESDFWVARKLWHEIPSGHVSVFIKGSMGYVPTKNSAVYRISFPQNRYYAPKKRAQELEKYRRDRALGVILSVASNGEAYIKGITVAGEKIYDEPIW